MKSLQICKCSTITLPKLERRTSICSSASQALTRLLRSLQTGQSNGKTLPNPSGWLYVQHNNAHLWRKSFITLPLPKWRHMGERVVGEKQTQLVCFIRCNTWAGSLPGQETLNSQETRSVIAKLHQRNWIRAQWLAPHELSSSTNKAMSALPKNETKHPFIKVLSSGKQMPLLRQVRLSLVDLYQLCKNSSQWKKLYSVTIRAFEFWADVWPHTFNNNKVVYL